MCVCVIKTHLWKQLSWPPTPLPHPVPAVSQQLTATYCPPPLLCTSNIPVPLLVSFLSTSPFPLSTHWFCPIFPVIGFPCPYLLVIAFLLSPLFDFPLLFSDIAPSFLPSNAHLAFSLPLLMSILLSLCSTSVSLTAICCKLRCWPEASTPWLAKLQVPRVT